MNEKNIKDFLESLGYPLIEVNVEQKEINMAGFKKEYEILHLKNIGNIIKNKEDKEFSFENQIKNYESTGKSNSAEEAVFALIKEFEIAKLTDMVVMNSENYESYPLREAIENLNPLLTFENIEISLEESGNRHILEIKDDRNEFNRLYLSNEINLDNDTLMDVYYTNEGKKSDDNDLLDEKPIEYCLLESLVEIREKILLRNLNDMLLKKNKEQKNKPKI
jgi:hypothetical protein